MVAALHFGFEFRCGSDIAVVGCLHARPIRIWTHHRQRVNSRRWHIARRARLVLDAHHAREQRLESPVSLTFKLVNRHYFSVSGAPPPLRKGPISVVTIQIICSRALCLSEMIGAYFGTNVAAV